MRLPFSDAPIVPLSELSKQRLDVAIIGSGPAGSRVGGGSAPLWVVDKPRYSA